MAIVRLCKSKTDQAGSQSAKSWPYNESYETCPLDAEKRWGHIDAVAYRLHGDVGLRRISLVVTSPHIAPMRDGALVHPKL